MQRGGKRIASLTKTTAADPKIKFRVPEFDKIIFLMSFANKQDSCATAQLVLLHFSRRNLKEKCSEKSALKKILPRVLRKINIHHFQLYALKKTAKLLFTDDFLIGLASKQQLTFPIL